MSPHCHTFVQALRAKGYRLTPQREMVIEVLAHSGTHVTAEEVFAQVQKRTHAINIATVYRTLDLLVAEGLATSIPLGDNRLVYATNRHGPHVHLLCRKCGRTIEADEHLLATFGRKVQSHHGFAVDLQHICIPGLCADCQAEESTSATQDESVGGSHAHS